VYRSDLKRVEEVWQILGKWKKNGKAWVYDKPNVKLFLSDCGTCWYVYSLETYDLTKANFK